MTRAVCLLIASVMLGSLLLAVVSRGPRAPEPGMGILAGRVVDAITGRPGVGVTVMAESSETFRTRTGATGRFRIPAVPPGVYTVRVSDARMFGAVGQMRPGAEPASVPVDAGEVVGDLVVPLWPGGAISGRVYSLDGRAQPAVAVRIIPSADESAWVEVRTDEGGGYHAGRLGPGRYRVVVPVMRGAADGDVPMTLTTFAPDTPEPASARTIALDIGEHQRGVDVRMRATSVANLSGVIEAAPVDGTFFRLRLFRHRELDRLGLPDAMLEVSGGGAFAFRGLPREAYTLEVERKVAGTEDMVYWPVRTPVDLRGGDATIRLRFGDDMPLDTTIDVDTTLARQVTSVQGHVRGAAGGDSFAVVVFPTDRKSWVVEPGVGPERLVRQRLGNEGRYAIVGLPSGEYFVGAVPETRLEEWPLPYLLARIAEHANRLTLRAGEHLVADLSVR